MLDVMLITRPDFRRRTQIADPVIPRRPRLDRINTEADFESRLNRMNISPERSMAPPVEGRRSITTNSLLGGHSGGSTPRSLPTPQLPVAPGRSKTIAENFTQYTQAVLHTATKTIHHDTVKKRLEKQVMEADRWRKHYQSFETMAEEQTRQLKKFEALAARSDDSLRNSGEVQERAIDGMVYSMVAAGQSKPTPVVELDARSKHSDKEVGMLRDELNDTRKRLDTVLNDTKRRLDAAVQDIARFNGKVSFQRSRFEDQIQEFSRDYVTKQTMTATESKMAEAIVNISKLQASSVKQTELNDKYITIVDQINQLSLVASDVEKAKEDISKLSVNSSANEIAGQKLKEDFESHMKDFDQLKSNVLKQEEKFVELNDYVTGNENPEEKSLTDIVREGALKSAKHAEALQALNIELGELDNLKEESKDLSVRIAKLESGSSKQSSASVNHQASSTGLEGEVAILKEEVARIFGEQQMKDDIVGEEVDQLRSLLNQKNGEVEQLRNLLDSQIATIKEMNDQILQLQSQQSTAGLSQNGEVEQLRNLVQSQGIVIKGMNDQLLEMRSHEQTTQPPQFEGLEQLRKTVDSQGVVIREMNDQVLKLHSHSAAEAPQIASKPSAQVSVFQAPDDPVRLRIKELETSLQQFTASTWEKVSNMEVFVASQEQRFNNLTTEHMARSIISQLQKMYPNHPGNVMNELRRVNSSQQALEKPVRSLENQLAEVRNFLGPNHLILAQQSTIPDLQIAIRKTSDRIEKVAQMHQDSSSAVNDMKDLVEDHSSQIEGFKADISTLKKDHLSAIGTSQSEVQAIKANIKDMDTTLKTDIEDIKSAVETSKINYETIKAELKDIAVNTINECYHIHGEINTLSEQISQRASPSGNKKNPDFDPSSPPSKYTAISAMRKHKNDNLRGGAGDDEHTPSPSSIPRSIGKHKKENLKPPTSTGDADSDASLLSPSSRQRAGSERSAASAAKVKLANEAKAVREANEAAAAAGLGPATKEGKSRGVVNGGTPTRKSGRKRGRPSTSDGDESDYHPMKKIGRPD